MVISKAWYLIDKGEYTALYKISQTYKYTHKPKQIIYKYSPRAHAQHQPYPSHQKPL